MLRVPTETPRMAPTRNNRELAFAINDVARLLRTYADQRAAQFGMTRAKWAVLARLDRFEGLKQAELAEMLDLQPISLTRLLDGLAGNGLIERRPDPEDRRAKRLFLTPAARPLQAPHRARRRPHGDRTRGTASGRRRRAARRAHRDQGQPAARRAAQTRRQANRSGTELWLTRSSSSRRKETAPRRVGAAL